MNVFKSPRARILFVILGGLCFTVQGFSQEREEGKMIIKFEKEKVNVEANSGKATTKFRGEVVYHIIQNNDEMTFQLESLGLVALSVETTQGDSGNISILLKPGSTVSKYTHKTMTITSEFIVDVHYPLIDKIKGFKKMREEEKESDDFRSYTESFTGILTCSFKDKPQLDSKKAVKSSAKIKLKMKLKMKDRPQDTMDNIRDIGGDFDAVEVYFFPG